MSAIRRITAAAALAGLFTVGGVSLAAAESDTTGAAGTTSVEQAGFASYYGTGYGSSSSQAIMNAHFNALGSAWGGGYDSIDCYVAYSHATQISTNYYRANVTLHCQN